MLTWLLKYLHWCTNAWTLVISLETSNLELQKLCFWSVTPVSRNVTLLISCIISKFPNACFHVGSFGTTTISCLASLLISSALEVRYWSIPINSKFVNVLLDIQETLITNKGKLAHFFAQKEFVKLYFILMDFADKIFGRHA